MAQDYDLIGLVERIKLLRSTATELKALSGGMQAVECNADRMLACVRLLELDFSDVIDIVYDKAPESVRA